MSETIVIAGLAIITFLLYNAARNQKRKARNSRRRIVDRAKRRE